MTPNETVQEWRLNTVSASTLLPIAIPFLLLACGVATLIASAFGKVQVNDFNFGLNGTWLIKRGLRSGLICHVPFFRLARSGRREWRDVTC